ncbi:hypothetical protein COCNU_scaffold012134G000010 [Cocos nucifera]|nr:hypothetical protein [Cocos nucifera]
MTSTKVGLNIKAPPNTEVRTVSVDSLPPSSSSLHAGGQASEPSIKREKMDDKKNKKSIVVKIVRKAHSDVPSDGSDDLGEYPFKNLETIWDLTDKFAMPELGHQILTHINKVHCHEAEALKAKEELQVEIEEERRKEAQIKVINLEARMAKLISKVMAWVVEEFKASSKIRNLNVAFGQQAFIKDFKLCEGRVARKFLELEFLEEEDLDEEVEPSNAMTDPTPTEPASYLPEPTMKMPEPTQKLEVAKSTPTSSTTASLNVESLE